MNIGLGAYLLSGTPGYRQAGIHQYIRALIEAMDGVLSDQPRRMSVTALVSPTARGELAFADAHSSIAIEQASRSTETPLSRIRVEQFETPRILRELRADLYHGMAFVAPLRAPCPTVITVHDLSFITRPHTHKLFNRTYLRLFTRWSCRRAARVIADSEWTKRDVVALLGVNPEHVDVIPLGVHTRYRPLPRAQVVAFQQTNRIGAHSVFFLGSLEPRKNLPVLVEAFARVLARIPNATLLVGGSPGWKYQAIFERIAALGLKDKVRFIGQIEQEQLPLWYNACAAFAYPSLYEGFGLPALEAMACGAPVVTSNATSLPEVVGDAGMMVAPDDIAGLAEALAQVLSDDGLRRELREKSLRRAAGFTWKRSAELTLACYERTHKWPQN
ncbi:MAG: glycosyltransferase family 4 protein [Chloroflexi bacterium]|nr:glycosyltransferase family 4 protein [Chloroflexota bacterium]MCL5274444.1 glycosyltransferase family 4 protein [Chloroflexota bacterium]